MMTWTPDELTAIGDAGELRIAARRRDGTLSRPRTIWVVRHGDDLYVRSVNGPTAAWYRGAQVRHEGHIEAGGVSKDVTFADPKTPGVPASTTSLTPRTAPSTAIPPAPSATSSARRHDPRRSGSCRAPQSPDRPPTRTRRPVRVKSSVPNEPWCLWPGRLSRRAGRVGLRPCGVSRSDGSADLVEPAAPPTE